MFCAIDNDTNDIVIAENLREYNYKDTYNYNKKYTCCHCNDNKVIFINSLSYQFHFRHSGLKICSESQNNFRHFNKHYYKNWFKLFKNEYRKPYWYNYKLEEISSINQIIMIRYTKMKIKTIKYVESNFKENKIIWILSIKNRKFSNINYNNEKFYMDFRGYKNDIPLFDYTKSIVYLDTETDILIKINLNNYNHLGQEIEFVNIIDFCKEYNQFLYACPLRKKTKNLVNSIIDLNYKISYIINIKDKIKKYKNADINILNEILKSFSDITWLLTKLKEYNIVFFNTSKLHENIDHNYNNLYYNECYLYEHNNIITILNNNQ